MERPPMIPVICSDRSFVYCTDHDAKQYAANEALVGQLLDSAACWLSHSEEVIHRFDDVLGELDKLDELDPCLVQERFSLLEQETSFFHQFTTDQVCAVMRVLKFIPQGKKQLQLVDASITTLKELNAKLQVALEYLDILCPIVANSADGSPWSAEIAVTAAQPYFSALRAIYLCCDLLGHKNPERFSCLVRFFIGKIERTNYGLVNPCIASVCDQPQRLDGLKRHLVTCQDSCVTVQEEYHKLRLGIAETSPVLTCEVYKGIDEAVLFDTIEWQFDRITVVLQLLETLKKQPHKIGSVITDELMRYDLMDPIGVTQESLLALADRLENAELVTPEMIIERIELKSKAAAATLAPPRPKLERLTENLIIAIQFNPPTVNISGGPLSPECLEEIAAKLPSCCSNETVPSVLRKIVTKFDFKRFGEYSYRLELPLHFCDSDLAHSHFMLVILDAIEKDGFWRMTDTHSGVNSEQEVYQLFMHYEKPERKDPPPAESKAAHANQHQLLAIASPPTTAAAAETQPSRAETSVEDANSASA